VPSRARRFAAFLVSEHLGVDHIGQPSFQRTHGFHRGLPGGHLGVEVGAATTVVEVFERNPDALLDHVAAYEIGLAVQTQRSPLFHALWMFVADLIAAAVPVIPFVFLPIQTAVVVALVVTGLWTALLGIARGRIGGVNIWRSAAQAMTIAGAAALAGVLMGRLVSTH
jgi:predicted membrane protein (TIGR00267 family)